MDSGEALSMETSEVLKSELLSPRWSSWMRSLLPGHQAVAITGALDGGSIYVLH